MLMKIKLSSSYGNISHPNHICPSPAKCWKRLKAEREAKLHALNCTCQSLLSVSPKVISHQGPQRTDGNVDTCGAGSMNCWEEKLTAGVRAAGRSETSNWDVAVRCPLPTNSTPFLQGLDWPPFSDTCSFSCLPPPQTPFRSAWASCLLSHPPFGGRVKPHLMLSSNTCLPSPSSATAAVGVRTASLTLPSPNLSAGRNLFSHQHAQQSRQLPSAIIRPHLTLPSAASCWYN